MRDDSDPVWDRECYTAVLMGGRPVQEASCIVTLDSINTGATPPARVGAAGPLPFKTLGGIPRCGAPLKQGSPKKLWRFMPKPTSGTPDQTRPGQGTSGGGFGRTPRGGGGVFQVKKEPGSTMGQSALFKNRTGRFSSQDYA